jgi:phasin family protein
MKSTLAEMQQNVLKALSTKDEEEWYALTATLIQPTGEKMLSYQRQLLEIGAATQAEFAEVTEAQFEAHNRHTRELIDNLAKGAPAGSDSAIGALTSVITATNRFYETVYQIAKQAVEAAERNFNIASSTASKPAGQAVEHESRTAKA